MIEHLLRLFDHMEWADRRILASLGQSPAPPPKALTLLAHLAGAERIWLCRVRREDSSRFAVWPPDLTLAQCAELLEANHTGYQTFLRTVAPADLSVRVPYRSSKGDAFETALEDILLHVALHGAYHRGQISALVRGAGLEPASTDFIAFARA
jgi:uncharacterized damage-inducible protein DinB